MKKCITKSIIFCVAISLSFTSCALFAVGGLIGSAASSNKKTQQEQLYDKYANKGYGWCCYFDGYWSAWQWTSSKQYMDVSMSVRGSKMTMYGNYYGIMCYGKDQGKWAPFFKFNITSGKENIPTSDRQRKQDVKAGKWYTCQGTVEYYVTDRYPTMKSIFKEYKEVRFVQPKEGAVQKKIVSNATIKIQAFEDHPVVYNIYFDNIGVAFHLGNHYFNMN